MKLGSVDISGFVRSILINKKQHFQKEISKCQHGLIFFSVLYFVAVIIIAHFFVPSKYHWIQKFYQRSAAQELQYQ